MKLVEIKPNDTIFLNQYPGRWRGAWLKLGFEVPECPSGKNRGGDDVAYDNRVGMALASAARIETARRLTRARAVRRG